jgi:antitoxin (DNA-binding transcriptional repressor) of toxin-antitoxin stability system
MIAEYITISEFRDSPTRLCRSVSVGKKEYIVTSNGLPIFKIVKPLPLDKKVSVKTMRDSLANFQNLLEEHGAVTLTAYGKPLVRCVKL